MSAKALLSRFRLDGTAARAGTVLECRRISSICWALVGLPQLVGDLIRGLVHKMGDQDFVRRLIVRFNDAGCPLVIV